jgi:hypothetical protein
MPLTKPWLEATDESVRRIPGTLGVYEIGDADGEILYIGFAGGRSRIGLRGEIERRLAPGGRRFRYEVNLMYLTRYIELLERHEAATGALPPENLRPGEYVPGHIRRAAARRTGPGG